MKKHYIALDLFYCDTTIRNTVNVRNKQDYLRYLYMLFYLNKKKYAKHHLDTFTQLLKSTPEYTRKASKTRKLNKKKKIDDYYKGFNKKEHINKHLHFMKEITEVNKCIC